MVSWQAFPSLPSSSRVPHVSLARKTPFPFPFKRLPRRLVQTLKREAVQFFVAKNLAVNHLPLEALPAVQT